MNQPTQQQDMLPEENLVMILKRVDMGTADHDDMLELAAALGLSRYFQTQLEKD